MSQIALWTAVGTAKGKAMRAASVGAKTSIEPTPRPYAHHQAYCLFFSNGSCGEGIDPCPVRAIIEAGQDKEKFRQHLARSREYVKEACKFAGYGCGLFQVGVPCETGFPVKAAREALERGELPSPPPPWLDDTRFLTLLCERLQPFQTLIPLF